MKSIAKEFKQLFIIFLSILIIFSCLAGNGTLVAFADSAIPQIENELLINFNVDTPDNAGSSEATETERDANNFFPNGLALVVENRPYIGTDYDLNNLNSAYILINDKQYYLDYRFINNFNVILVNPKWAFVSYFSEDNYSVEYALRDKKTLSQEQFDYIIDKINNIRSCYIVLKYSDDTIIQESISIRLSRNGVTNKFAGRKYFSTTNAFVTVLPDSKNLNDAAFYELENAIKFVNDTDSVSNRYYINLDDKNNNVLIPLDQMSDSMILTEALLDNNIIYQNSAALNYGKRTCSWEVSDWIDTDTQPDDSVNWHLSSDGRWVETADQPIGIPDQEWYYDDYYNSYFYFDHSPIYSYETKHTVSHTYDNRTKVSEAIDVYRYNYTDKKGNTIKGYSDENNIESAIYELLNSQNVPFVFLDNSVQPNIQTVYYTIPGFDQWGDSTLNQVFIDTDVNEEFENVDFINMGNYEYDIYNDITTITPDYYGKTEESVSQVRLPRYKITPVMYTYSQITDNINANKGIGYNQSSIKKLAYFILNNSVMPTRIKNISLRQAIENDYDVSEIEEPTEVSQETEGFFHIEFNQNVDFAGAFYNNLIKANPNLNKTTFLELGIPKDNISWLNNSYNNKDKNEVTNLLNMIESDTNIYMDFTAIGNYIENGEEKESEHEYHDFQDLIQHCTSCKSITWKAFDYQTLEDIMKFIFDMPTRNTTKLSINDINFNKSYVPDYLHINDYKSDISFKDYFNIYTEKGVGKSELKVPYYDNIDLKNYASRQSNDEISVSNYQPEIYLEDKATDDTPIANINNKTLTINTESLKTFKKGTPYNLYLQFLTLKNNDNYNSNNYNGGDVLHSANYYNMMQYATHENVEYKWGEFILASNPGIATNISYDNDTRKLSWNKPIDEGLGLDDENNTQRDGYVYLTSHTLKIYDENNNLVHEQIIDFNGEDEQTYIIPENIIDDDHAFSFEIYATNTIGTSEAARFYKAKIDKPSLKVEKSSEKSYCFNNDSIIFEDTITNTGNVDLNNVILTENLNGHFINTITDNTIVNNNIITISKLLVGQSISFKYEVIANDETITNNKVNSSITATCDENVQDTANVTVDIKNPSIKVEKSSNNTEYLENDTVTFTNTITNIGDILLTNVIISEDLNGTFVDTNNKNITINNQINKAIIDELAIGESITIEYKIIANNDNTVNHVLTSKVSANSAEGAYDDASCSVNIIEPETNNDNNTTDSTSDSDEETEKDSDRDSDSSTDTNTDVSSELDTDTSTESDIDTSTDTESDSDIVTDIIEESDSDTDTYTDDTDIIINSDTESDTESNVDSDSESDTESNSESDVDSESKVDTESDSDTIDSDKDSDKDSDTESDVNYDSDTDSNIDTESDSDSESDTDSDTESNSDTDSEVDISNPLIKIKKTSDKSQYYIGDTIIFNDIITNIGNIDLTNIIITENIDGSFINENVEGITIDNNKVIISKLSIGQSIILQYKINANDTNININNNSITSIVKAIASEGCMDEAILTVNIKEKSVPTPDTPNKPDTPKTPDTPKEPNTPDTPKSTTNTPNTPSSPNTTKIETPTKNNTPVQTGDTRNINMCLMLLICTLMYIIRNTNYRKRDK